VAFFLDCNAFVTQMAKRFFEIYHSWTSIPRPLSPREKGEFDPADWSICNLNGAFYLKLNVQKCRNATPFLPVGKGLGIGVCQSTPENSLQ
jgi:hypothetical protein